MFGGLRHRPASWSSLNECLSEARCRRLSNVPTRILAGENLGPTREGPHTTWRIRKDDQSGDLPLSPFLDPIVREKRTRWLEPKKRSRAADFTPFQKKLSENAFGTV